MTCIQYPDMKFSKYVAYITKIICDYAVLFNEKYCALFICQASGIIYYFLN